MSDTTVEQLEVSVDALTASRSSAIIDRHILSAMGVGLVPIPLVDILGIGAVQLNMIRRLAETYGVEYSEPKARSIILSLVGGALPVFGALPFASLAQAIPVIGWTVALSSTVILAGASTYAVGKIMENHFAKGGGIGDLDVKSARERFDDLVEQGKEAAKNLRAKGGK
jgi:uncharacterized protein (DUF697 family)